MAKAKKNAWVMPLVLVSLIAVGGFFAINYALQSDTTAFEAPATPPVVNVDEYTFTVYVDSNLDGLTELDEFNVTEYCKDISDLTEAEKLDLTYSDLTAQDRKEADKEETFDIESDEVQVFYISATKAGGFGAWVLQPLAGENIVYLINSTSSRDINLLAIERDGESTTFNQTNDYEWSVFLKAATTNENYTQGIDSVWQDFVNSTADDLIYNYVYIRIKFNTTASSHAYASCSDAIREITSGQYTYFYFSNDLFSDEFMQIEFDLQETGLGSTFEVTEIATGWGNVDTYAYVFDTQN